MLTGTVAQQHTHIVPDVVGTAEYINGLIAGLRAQQSDDAGFCDQHRRQIAKQGSVGFCETCNQPRVVRQNLRIAEHLRRLRKYPVALDGVQLVFGGMETAAKGVNTGRQGFHVGGKAFRGSVGCVAAGEIVMERTLPGQE